MDFITQNLLGAVAGHAALGRSREDGGLGRLALAAGALGGAVPDFDVFLTALADPALPFEFHRHFTHALLFIPLGGLLATLPFLVTTGGRRSFRAIFAAATIGCATHGLLDNLTSYGTHLFWPFISGRTAWDAMSIVDPLFSGVLFLGIVIAVVRGRTRPTRLAMTLALLYIAFGFVQNGRAESAQEALARERGHEIRHGRVVPTLANIVVFRSIYEADGRLWADAIRVTPFGAIGVRDGASIARFTEADLPAIGPERLRRVFGVFESFADGFVGAVDPAHTRDGGLVLGDMRITGDTTGFRALWGISIDDRGAPAAWDGMDTPSDGETARRVLRGMLDDLIRPEGRFRPLTASEHPSRPPPGTADTGR